LSWRLKVAAEWARRSGGGSLFHARVKVRALFKENEVRWKVRLLSILSVHIIKCAKMRALFAENKARFARAEQLCQKPEP